MGKKLCSNEKDGMLSHVHRLKVMNALKQNEGGRGCISAARRAGDARRVVILKPARVKIFVRGADVRVGAAEGRPFNG